MSASLKYFKHFDNASVLLNWFRSIHYTNTNTIDLFMHLFLIVKFILWHLMVSVILPDPSLVQTRLQTLVINQKTLGWDLWTGFLWLKYEPMWELFPGSSCFNFISRYVEWIPTISIYLQELQVIQR